MPMMRLVTTRLFIISSLIEPKSEYLAGCMVFFILGTNFVGDFVLFWNCLLTTGLEERFLALGFGASEVPLVLYRNWRFAWIFCFLVLLFAISTKLFSVPDLVLGVYTQNTLTCKSSIVFLGS